MRGRKPLVATLPGDQPRFLIGSSLPAQCSDGVVRMALILREADTYFTVPARVTVRGKTVTGFVYWSGPMGNGPLAFSPNAWQRNAGLLPPAA